MRILMLLLGIGLALPLSGLAVEGPDAVEYPSRWGIVTFKHQLHQQRVNDCLVCHHQGVEMGACSACHGVLPTTPIRKDVLHKQCKDCHRERRGPTHCAGCHNPEFVDEAVFRD